MEVLYLQPMIKPKRFDLFPSDLEIAQKVWMRSDFSLKTQRARVTSYFCVLLVCFYVLLIFVRTVQHSIKV